MPIKTEPFKAVDYSAIEKRVADRMQGRDLAKLLIEDAVKELNKEEKEGFYRELINIGKEKSLKSLTKEEKDTVWSKLHIQVFEQTVCMYQKYKGIPWGQVPISYMRFLLGNVEDLAQYLKTQKAKDREIREQAQDRFSD